MEDSEKWACKNEGVTNKGNSNEKKKKPKSTWFDVFVVEM